MAELLFCFIGFLASYYFGFHRGKKFGKSVLCSDLFGVKVFSSQDEEDRKMRVSKVIQFQRNQPVGCDD